MNISIDHYIETSDIPVGNYTISDEELNKLLALEVYASKYQNFDSWDAKEIKKLLKNTKKVQQWASQYRIDDAQKRTLVNEHLQAGGFKKARIGRKLKFSKSLYLVAKRKRNQWEHEAQQNQQEIAEERAKLQSQFEQCNEKILELTTEWKNRLAKVAETVRSCDATLVSLLMRLGLRDQGVHDSCSSLESFLAFKDCVRRVFDTEGMFSSLPNKYKDINFAIKKASSSKQLQHLTGVVDNFCTILASDEALTVNGSQVGFDLSGLLKDEKACNHAIKSWIQEVVEKLQGLEKTQSDSNKWDLNDSIGRLQEIAGDIDQ
ncbi:MAG: hypothetical protein LW808_002025 [Verrucomicrobiota bacterium]|nr:MAG: hypothetical protein LW808_002025 [Verrucomicrobiota bacterium]